ncbi:MAG: RIO1 family regulatory kinase/ATPase [Candidatus Promineifilaceae bacterium]
MSHNTIYDDYEKYLAYESQSKRKLQTRQQRRKPKQKQAKAWTKNDSLRVISQALQIENVEFTYIPGEHESGWVLAALQSFFQEEYIIDVLGLVKGGKEANVYQCRAHPSLGVEFVAAKIYRPKMFRQLRNDAMYKEGRAILDNGGGVVTERNKREMRAIKHKSKFGDFLSHQSWLMHEFSTLEMLYEAGISVPKPYAMASNAILFGFIGDADGAAPLLSSVNLRKQMVKGEIHRLFRKTIDTIELMVQSNLIHGDLSAYNILFWNNDIVFIDFPQATNAKKNRNARFILQRDIQRVCDYFQKHGIVCRPHAITDKLWFDYIALSEAEEEAELSQMMLKS